MTTAIIAATPKKHSSNHLSVHQWIRSAIRDSQQPTSPVVFLFLKLLPPPPCAALLDTTGIYTYYILLYTYIYIYIYNPLFYIMKSNRCKLAWPILVRFASCLFGRQSAWPRSGAHLLRNHCIGEAMWTFNSPGDGSQKSPGGLQGDIVTPCDTIISDSYFMHLHTTGSGFGFEYDALRHSTQF